MVSRSFQVIAAAAIALVISGCATRTEVVTLTEYVDVPVIEYREPRIPEFFGKGFEPSDVTFLKCDEMICIDDANSRLLRYDIEILSGRIRAQKAWYDSIMKKDKKKLDSD